MPNTAFDPVVIPLYRHAQQPVVPDESYQQLSELYHAQEKRLFKIAQRIKGPAFDKYSHSPSQAIDVLEVAIFGDDESCRAAMLAADPQPTRSRPGSEPATVPAKWIPVSERMPEIRKGFLDTTVIIAFDGEPEGSEAIYCIDGNFRWGRDEDPIANVTHWMPLPAAPQEVKGE